jgi:hypothetical protein
MHNPSFSSTLAHKRGFALIITLSVLSVIIALTGVMISYLDTVRKEASSTKALLQANLYYADAKKIITGFKEKKTLYNLLYLSPVPLQSEDGRFSLILECHPLASGININWLGYDNNEKMTEQYSAAQKVFESLVQNYNVSDPGRLEEVLLGVIKGNQDERESRLRQKNGIISYRQFMQLLDRYQFETGDKKIGRIPWRKYFIFTPVPKRAEENVIAGDYLSVELLSVLFNIDIESLKEEWVPAEGAIKTLLDRYGIVYDKRLYAEKFVDRSQCEVTYMYEDERFMFAFVDDEGEVKDFEFYGKQ